MVLTTTRSECKHSKAWQYLTQCLCMYSGIHRTSLKLIQILAQQAETLICWIISIEPETGIAGMVISAVEVLKHKPKL